MTQRNILVTGGAGFIGSAVVRRLVGKGHRVVNLDSLTYSGNRASLESVADAPNYRFVQADIADQDRVAAFPTSTEVGVTDNVIRGLLAGAPQAANDNRRDATSPIVSSLTRNINILSRGPAPRDARVIPMRVAI